MIGSMEDKSDQEQSPEIRADPELSELSPEKRSKKETEIINQIREEVNGRFLNHIYG